MMSKLNLLTVGAFSSESSGPVFKAPPVAPDINKNDDAIIGEHVENSKIWYFPPPNVDHSSSLPPNGEETIKEIRGIWVIVNDEGECNDALDINVDIPSPSLPSEASPRFQSSPTMDIEEFMQALNLKPVTTSRKPSTSTPMPSPRNCHSACNDVFCPNQNCLSENSNLSFNSPSSPMAPHSPACKTEEPRTIEKRKKNEQECSDIKRKRLRNSGQKCVTRDGKIITKEEKTMRPPCECRFKCADKVSYEQRFNFFARFWQLGDNKLRWNFVVKHSERIKPKTCFKQNIKHKRRHTYKYYLPLIIGKNKKPCVTIKVCRTMFLNTLTITPKFVNSAWKKYDDTIVEDDKRGDHNNRKVIIINDAVTKSVCDHIRAFAPIESHYIRKDSQKVYLPKDLNISKMYKLYLEWFNPEEFTCKASTMRQYRDIVNSNFNISFRFVKKSRCNYCFIYRLNNNPTDEEDRVIQEHDDIIMITRLLKNGDKKAAIGSDGRTVTAVFDFQKNLTCPYGKPNVYYYKRKLTCFNFTIFDIGKKQGICYIWDETIAKNGANEICSCLLQFIQANVEKGVKEFRFWSENCPSHYDNRIVYSFYTLVARKFNISITHRFLRKGHGMNEVDSVHSVIERASQNESIYTPDEWRQIAKKAKCEEPSNLVINITQSNIYDFRSQIITEEWLKNIYDQKIQWNSVREVYTVNTQPNKLYYKYDLDQNNYDVLVLQGKTSNILLKELTLAYSQPLKLSEEKYKDLLDLVKSQDIPLEYSEYFKSLPYQTHPVVNESSDSDMELSE